MQKSPQNRRKIAAKLSYEMHLLYQEDSNLTVCKNEAKSHSIVEKCDFLHIFLRKNVIERFLKSGQKYLFDGNPNGLFPFQEHVPVFHNVQIPYVHQLQNVLHEHNENISIHMQIFKI